MKFSIGYNQDIRLLDLLDVYKDHLEALYFPIPSQYLGSGRARPQKAGYANEIPEILNKCNSLNIRSQLVLNPTCVGESGLEKKFFLEIIDYIQGLTGLGLKSVIVTNPIYICEIKERIRGIEVESSVNCYVKTVEHASYLKDLGVDILTIDRDINRNIPLIKEIKNKTGLKIKILLNEACLRNCPFRNAHFNFTSHDQFKNNAEMISGIMHHMWCMKIFAKYPEKILSAPFIPPGALKYYTEFTDYFKISSRGVSTSLIEFRLKAYMNQDFNGNLLSLMDGYSISPYFAYMDSLALDENGFFEKMLKCSGRCDECNYCKELMNKAIITNSSFFDPDHPNRIQESERAVRIYRRILDTFPEAYDIHFRLANVYYTLKNYEEAIHKANKAMKLAPKEIGPYLLLGSCYEETKRNGHALEVYKKALEIFPNEGAIYLGLARAHFKLKNYEEAINNTNKAMELNYEDKNTHLLLGFCYGKKKKYEKAIEELKKAEERDPEEAEINLSLCNCFRNIGQIEQANKELEKGVRKIKKKPTNKNS